MNLPLGFTASHAEFVFTQALVASSRRVPGQYVLAALQERRAHLGGTKVHFSAGICTHTHTPPPPPPHHTTPHTTQHNTTTTQTQTTFQQTCPRYVTDHDSQLSNDSCLIALYGLSGEERTNVSAKLEQMPDNALKLSVTTNGRRPFH